LEDSHESQDGDEEPEPEPLPEPEPEPREPEPEEPEPEPQPEPEPSEDEPEEEKLSEIMMLRLGVSENYELVRDELAKHRGKNILIHVTSREQVEGIKDVVAEERSCKVLLPQYLLDLIPELNLDKNKFLPFEDKSL
jgi:cell division septation protein DedD